MIYKVYRAPYYIVKLGSLKIKPLIPYPALLLEDSIKALVIADLHIGWDIELSSRGIHIPSQTFRLKAKLREIAGKTGADMLFILGDVKHTIASAELSEWRDIPDFFDEALELFDRVIVVPGNHDGGLELLAPSGVEIADTKGILWSGVALMHGHTWPRLHLLEAKVMLMGHLHPTISFRDPFGLRFSKPVWLRVPFDRDKLIEVYSRRLRKSMEELTDLVRVEKLIVLPSFNDLLGGQSVNSIGGSDELLGPIFRSVSVMLDEAEVYIVDGTYIGKLSFLRAF